MFAKIKNVNKDFRSELEEIFARQLIQRKIDYVYEPEAITIIEPFNTTWKQFRASTYTPDFLIEWNKRKIYIEVKGDFFRKYETQLISLKNKLVARKIQDLNAEFYMVKYVRNNFYLANSNVKENSQFLSSAKTFFQSIGIDKPDNSVLEKALMLKKKFIKHRARKKPTPK